MNLRKLVVVFCFSVLGQFAHAASPEIFYENASNTPIFKLLQLAKSSIDIEIYEIQDTQIQAEVLAALDRGVKVRVIQESEAVGSNCPVFDKIYARDAPECRVQKDLVQKVQAKGGSYIPFAYQQFCSDKGQFRCLEHGKIILIDHQKALISTGNFNATNLCDQNGVPQGDLTTCNRDYTIVSTDPNVVATLTSIFNADFKGKAYDLSSILRSKTAQKVTVSPLSLSPIVQFINSATKSIFIENQYLKDIEMNAALVAASKRGVNVVVVVSSICAFGKPDPVKNASAISQWNSTYKAFDTAGIKSRIFTKDIKVNNYNGYLHAKAIVVDGNRAWVGSVNGSTQALSQNREFGVFVDDLEQSSKLEKYISSDYNNSNTESWQESLLCKKDF